MSMIGCFRRLAGADLERLFADPSALLDFLDEEQPSGYGPVADFDVDKAWHGIHYLLTGTAWDGTAPLDFIVRGGTEIGDEDVGYGPARGFSPAEVEVLSVALAPISPEDLRGRYEPKVMAASEIYPDIWVREGDEGLDYLLAYFDELQQFIADAAEAGDALIVYLS